MEVSRSRCPDGARLAGSCAAARIGKRGAHVVTLEVTPQLDRHRTIGAGCWMWSLGIRGEVQRDASTAGGVRRLDVNWVAEAQLQLTCRHVT
jgi:hypothetical protein